MTPPKAMPDTQVGGKVKDGAVHRLHFAVLEELPIGSEVRGTLLA